MAALVGVRLLPVEFAAAQTLAAAEAISVPELLRRCLAATVARRSR